MPEGPEVKNLVKWLNKDLKNKKLINIKIHSGRYKKHGPPKNLNKLVYPLIIDKVNCHGKFIYLTLKNSDLVIFITLGMSGWFVYENSKYNAGGGYYIDGPNMGSARESANDTYSTSNFNKYHFLGGYYGYNNSGTNIPDDWKTNNNILKNRIWYRVGSSGFSKLAFERKLAFEKDEEV